jgi:hypothetical protein
MIRRGLSANNPTGGMKMARVKELTIDELACFIEQKILEVLGDPDSR